MEWEVEFTDEFGDWWNGLTEDEQAEINAKVILLQKLGPALPRPHADLIRTSRHPNMKELRIQHSGRPYRVLFAFDPRRLRHAVDWRRQNRERAVVRRIRSYCGCAL